MRTLVPSLLWFSALAPAGFAKAKNSDCVPLKSRVVPRSATTAVQTGPVNSISPKFQNNTQPAAKAARVARRQTI